MPYTGLTIDSTTNGVDFITTTQTGLTATITDAVLQISGTAARLNGAITILRSQISVFNPIVRSGSNIGSTSSIAYSAGNPNANSTTIVGFDRSSLSVQSNSGVECQITVSKIISSGFIETGAKNKLFVYLQAGCIISNSVISNINNIEFKGATGVFSTVSIIDSYLGALNYEVPRIDLIGLSVPSTVSGYVSALGELNSASFVFWNPVSLDFTKLLLTVNTNSSQLGYTVSWNIKDSNPINDALVVYRDDRANIGGSKAELARYTTDSTGTLTGTYDSKSGVTGSNISRPTLWVRTKQTRQTGVTVAQNPVNTLYTTEQISAQFVEKRYAVDLVSSEIEIRSYLHLSNATVISPTTQIGTINPDMTVKDFLSFVLTPDTGITQINRVTALAVAGIAHTAPAITVSTSRSIADIYDSRKAYWRDNGGATGVRIGTIADFGNLNVTIATGASLFLATATKFADGIQTSGIFTLTDPRAYNGVPFSVASGGSVVVSTGNTDLRSWIFAAGTVINISGAGSALVTVSATQLANVTAGAGVTLQAPVASISAPNFAQNTRVQVARLEPYSVPSTAIATATSIITIAGNRFKSAAPATLVYFQLQAGATIPTTSPQIANNTLYFVQASGVSDGLAAGQFKLSLTQSGAAIAFSNQGSGNFTLTGITELDNSLAGAGGYSVALTEPNGTLLRVSAQSWQNAIGCTAGNFYQQSLIWNSTGGNAIADTVSISANPDTIHNSLIGNSARVFNTNVTLPSDGSTVTGISFNAQGIISLDPRSFASVAGFPTITPQAAYLYTVYYRSTAAGIRVIANQFSAQDAANFAFSGLKLDNIADGIRNTPNTAAMIAGGYIATIDGSNPIAPASGAIYINADRRGVLVTTTSGSTIAPTQQQLRDAQALTLSDGVVAASGSIDSKLALIPTADNAPFVAAIKAQTDKLAFTTANRVDSTAIGVPVNPLLTTDLRLSNLDALVSSRATQISINALPTLTAIEGSIVLFKLSNYTAPDNAGIGSLNSKLTTIRTDGLDRLPNLDALITSRATPDQVWAVPYSGLTQTGTIGRMLYWVGKLFGATPAAVTASKTARSTSDGTINQTITTNPDGSKTMSGNP